MTLVGLHWLRLWWGEDRDTRPRWVKVGGMAIRVGVLEHARVISDQVVGLC